MPNTIIAATFVILSVLHPAMGERLVKRVRGTPDATWDDLLFTPLSFGLALCFAVVAAGPA